MGSACPARLGSHDRSSPWPLSVPSFGALSATPHRAASRRQSFPARSVDRRRCPGSLHRVSEIGQAARRSQAVQQAHQRGARPCGQSGPWVRFRSIQAAMRQRMALIGPTYHADHNCQQPDAGLSLSSGDRIAPRQCGCGPRSQTRQGRRWCVPPAAPLCNRAPTNAASQPPASAACARLRRG